MRKYAIIAIALVILAIFAASAGAFPFASNSADYQWPGQYKGEAIRADDVSNDGVGDVTSYYKDGGYYGIVSKGYSSNQIGLKLGESSSYRFGTETGVGNVHEGQAGNEVVFAQWSKSSPYTVGDIYSFNAPMNSWTQVATNVLPYGYEVTTVDVADVLYLYETGNLDEEIILGLTYTGGVPRIRVYDRDGTSDYGSGTSAHDEQMDVSVPGQNEADCEITDIEIGELGNIGSMPGSEDIAVAILCYNAGNSPTGQIFINVFFQRSYGATNDGFETQPDVIVQIPANIAAPIEPNRALHIGLGIGDISHDGTPDGKNDIVFNDQAGKVYILYNKGNGFENSPTYRHIITDIPTPTDVAVGDFNDDGRDDIAVAHQTVNPSSSVTLYYMPVSLGTAQLNSPYEIWKVDAGDVNGNGRDDVVGINWNTAYTFVFLQEETPHTAPVIHDISITPNPAYVDSDMEFNCTATDADDDELMFKWESDIDGVLYDGPKMNITKQGDIGDLSTNDHTITLTVYDAKDETKEEYDDLVGIILTDLPEVWKFSVTPDSAYQGEEVTFEAKATDYDGSVAKYKWTSNLHGVIYHGPKETITTDDLYIEDGLLEVGDHIIKVQAEDNLGALSYPANQTVLEIKKQVNYPVINEMRITPNPSEEEVNITFYVNATDSDGEIQYYKWVSSVDGQLYNGLATSFKKDSLSLGKHKITLTIEDDDGWKVSEEQELYIYTPFMPKLTSPQQILPRIGSVDAPMYAFNVTQPYFPCLVWRGAEEVGDCMDDDLVYVDECSSGTYAFEYDEDMFEEEGTYEFNFQNKPVETDVGEIAVDVNFYGSSLMLNVQTSIDIEDSEGLIIAQIYEIDGCKLSKSGDIIGLARYAPKKYYALLDDLPCEGDECDFAIEAIVVYPPYGGGVHFEYGYEPVDTGERVYLDSDDDEYFVGEVAELYAEVVNISNPSVEFNIMFPENYTPPSGEMEYNETEEYYFAELNLTRNGTFIINATAVSQDDPKIYANAVIAFEVGEKTVITVTVDPDTIDLGSFERGDTGTETITITNPNEDQDITNFRALKDTALGTSLEVDYEDDEIPADSLIEIDLDIDILPTASSGDYEGNILLRGDYMADYAIPVKYVITGGALEGTVTPSAWNLNSISAGSIVEKTFALDMSSGDTEGVAVEASTTATVFDFDADELDLEEADSITVALTAPDDLGEYTDSILFTFYLNDVELNEVEVEVSYKVVDNTGDLIKDAWDKHDRLTRLLENLLAEAGPGSKIAKKVGSNVTAAQSLLADAEDAILSAEVAFAAGDTSGGEDWISTANSYLTDADDIIEGIESLIKDSTKKSGSAMLPLAIVIISVLVFGVLVLALREGWLPAYKVPWLVDGFKKIGLEMLVEQPEKLSPKPRFTPTHIPPSSMSTRPRAGTGRPPATGPRASKVLNKEEQIKKQWADYYKQHPDYANKVRQQYRSYYHRRYQ
ncbi:MAG: VCBS repeat-containing protein [archaeon]